MKDRLTHNAYILHILSQQVFIHILKAFPISDLDCDQPIFSDQWIFVVSQAVAHIHEGHTAMVIIVLEWMYTRVVDKNLNSSTP